jgi:DNA repair protein RadC
VLGLVNISQGGMSETAADPKLIFVARLKATASYIILAHNYPSENLKPSTEDIRLKKKLVEEGKLLNLWWSII